MYRKPGDALDIAYPALFDIATKKEIEIDHALFPNPYDITRAGLVEGQPRASPSSTTSAGIRSTASSKWTRRPARRAR